MKELAYAATSSSMTVRQVLATPLFFSAAITRRGSLRLSAETASRCLENASTKQLVAEFATAAVKEKHKIDTLGKMSFPRLKYKGKEARVATPWRAVL